MEHWVGLDDVDNGIGIKFISPVRPNNEQSLKLNLDLTLYLGEGTFGYLGRLRQNQMFFFKRSLKTGYYL